MIRFEIESEAPPQVVIERLRASVRPKPDLLESLGRSWKRRDASGPPFVGSVGEDSFRIHRDFRGRNSFVPLIRGRVISTHAGARVTGIMLLHPVVAVFTPFWLGAVGYGALTDKSAPPVALWIMFIFGVSLAAGGFFVEASKAKRLLRTAADAGAGRDSVERMG